MCLNKCSARSFCAILFPFYQLVHLYLFFCCYCIIFLIHTHRLSLFESVIPCFCVAYISANMRSLADFLVYFQSELNEMG